MATITQDTEVVPYVIRETTPNFVGAGPTPAIILTIDVEIVSYTIRETTPNYSQAPIANEDTYVIDVEVILTGATTVSSSEEDIVTQFVIAPVTTSRTTLYTVPVGRNAVIRWLDLVNTTGSPITVDVWLNNVQWENDRSVAGSDKYARDTIINLAAGQLIEMQASGSGVNAFVAGVLELAS